MIGGHGEEQNKPYSKMESVSYNREVNQPERTDDKCYESKTCKEWNSDVQPPFSNQIKDSKGTDTKTTNEISQEACGRLQGRMLGFSRVRAVII
jgi:hypothetical protein